MTEINPSQPPVDLFQIAEEIDLKSKKETTLSEKTVIFVGESSSGKSSIISLLKGTLKEEPPKPTFAIEYSFARRNNNNNSKEIIHFYELAGGKFVKDLASVPLNCHTIANVTYVITLDLANPDTVLDSLIFWVENIKEHSEKAIVEAFENNPERINEFKQKKLKEYENYAEKQKMSLVYVDIIAVANKYDIIETEEIENRKWMSRILRYYCHVNGLSLYYSSIINPKIAPQIKSLLTSCFFGDNTPNVLQKDHMKPIFVSKGLDNIDSIGVTMAGNFSYIELLKKISKEYFPLKQSDSNKIFASLDFSKYSESLIDSTKAMKDVALQRTLKKHKFDSEKLEKFNKSTTEFGEKENENENTNILEHEDIANNNQESLKNNNNLKSTAPFMKKYRPSANKFTNKNNN